MSKKIKKSVPVFILKNSRKSVSQMAKDLSFTLSIDMFNCRKFTTSEIGRGCGVHKVKKGKGSYTRKTKYNKSYG